MTMEVTLDDDGADVTFFPRLDIIFDNDLIDWDDEDTEVLKGSWLNQPTEGDSTGRITHMKLFTIQMLDTLMLYKMKITKNLKKMIDTIG